MTKEEQAQLLLSKYLKGETSPAEAEQVERWYQSYEGQETLEKNRKSEISEEIRWKLQSQMAQKGEAKAHRIFALHPLAKVAAALFLVMASAIGYWSVYKTEAVKARLFTLNTSAREQKTVLLSDGSKIVMGPLSTLVYPQDFGKHNRIISLSEGEAFFSIAHEEKRPFIVKTSNHLYTKVLGTSFRIKSFKKQDHITIQVATGKVAVGNPNQLFGTLVKGQEISYDKVNQRAEIKESAVIPVDLKFEGIALEELIHKLEYAYNIQISLSSPALGRLKCTGIFSTKQSPAEILEIICSLHQLKFRTTENHKTFNVYRK